MNIIECLKVALRGLSNNKMRTALTMLGIIIGVGVVILVVAIGQGAAKSVTDTVNALGTNLLTLFPGQTRLVSNAVSKSTAVTTNTQVQTLAQASNHLTLQDSKMIASQFSSSIDAVAPQVRSNVQIRYKGVDSTTNCQGVDTAYPYVNNIDVLSGGRFFNDFEVEGNQKVCCIGVTILDKLLGNEDTNMVGESILINRISFKVIGVLTPKGAGAWGQDQDDVILIPITTAMLRVMNKTRIDTMSIRCMTPDIMPLVTEQVSAYLRIRHHLQPPFPDNDDFQIRSQTDLLNRQQSITNTMTSLLSAVAVISLVVGGIGIMNIMLVSVTERTREIGIRKAIGATPRDILLQFLIESAIISLLGGLIGIVLGVGGAIILAKVAGWNTIVDQTAVIAAVVVSAGVGLFFGIYPASKAAALHPIEALRYE
jgi:putative ABC transport system permease protein